MKKLLTGLLFAMCFLISNQAEAQVLEPQNDTIAFSFDLEMEEFYRSPKKASIYSALFPGLGQIYNQKYWKLPIIYGGFAGFIYGYSWNNSLYGEYFDAYRTISQYSSGTQMTPADKKFIEDFINNPSYDLDNSSQFSQISSFLESGTSFYRRNRDLTVVGMAAFYLLNIIDASVDAHFFDYDISDQLSINIEPAPVDWVYHNQMVGLKVNITF